ncbi:hypothetical protein BGZ83_003613, partial [Gryganskiella cystojenkinii]
SNLHKLHNHRPLVPIADCLQVVHGHEVIQADQIRYLIFNTELRNSALWLYGSTETILVIRDVGIQVKSVYLGGQYLSWLIDRPEIQDIIINEAITMLYIRVYMAIIVEGEDRMIVVFQNLLPRLHVLLNKDKGVIFL